MSTTDRDLTVDDYVQAVANGLPRYIAERSAMAIPGGLTQDERDELRGRLDALTAPDGADATTPETPAEPPRSAQRPPAGIPGSPNPAEGHTGPRAGRIVAMIVSRSSTTCSDCGGSAIPGYGDDQAHVMVSGYDRRKGCGATWTHVTTDMHGTQAEADAQALAPHLPWIDLGDVVRQQRAEAINRISNARLERNPNARLDRHAAACGTTLAAAGVDPGDVAAWDYQAPSGAETRHTLALRLKNGQHVTLTGPDPDGGASVARTGPEPAPDDAWAILGEVEDGIRRLDDAIRPLKLASDRSWAATQEHGRQIVQYRLTKAQERIETITGLLALRDGELASANAQRDQARAEVERLTGLLEDVRAATSAEVAAAWGAASARAAEVQRLRDEVERLRADVEAANQQADRRAERLRRLLTEALDGWEGADDALTQLKSGDPEPRIAEVRREAGL